MPGGRCPFPNCNGVVDGGYCNTCGRAPDAAASAATAAALARAQRPPPPGGAVRPGGAPPRMPLLRPASMPTGPTAGLAPAPANGRVDTGRTSPRRTGVARLGVGLVDVPAIPTGDPADAVLAVAEVPEDKRFCSGCDRPVGRSRNGKPGRSEGFCPACGSHFSFTPKLAPGDLVAGQYEVLGALAHGGLGWIYLARDRAVSHRWVVLKGLLDASSEDAALAAVAERRFLAELDHPNVVQIYNFVTHDGAGYIVMEYVGGKSLKTVLKERRDAKGGEIDPMPCDQAIAYMLGVLPALGYLHESGWVYCDMKPDNVVLTGDSLKIIDVGGVRNLDDDQAAIYGTVGYQAPEVAELGPSVVSDLYTVGRTLAVLVLPFRGYQHDYVDRLPPPSEQPLLAERESLHRFLLKATAADPVDRFTSAGGMAEQLLGVLREDAAAKGHFRPATSSIFGPDGLVGTTSHQEVYADWRLLPKPKVDPTDPGAGFLLGLADAAPDVVIGSLNAAWAAGTAPQSVETILRMVRAQLDLRGLTTANATLHGFGEIRDWRVWWFRGLVSLAERRPLHAVDWLDPVYTELPGEVAPKLALALAHELAGDLARAAELYDRVSRTDPAHVSGAFGLARARLGSGDRDGAVEALQRVPTASSVHRDAQIAMVRALGSAVQLGWKDRAAARAPSPQQLERASALLVSLDLEAGQRALLQLELYEAGLFVIAAGAPASAGEVLGRPLLEASLREGLEEAYRQLARVADSPRKRVRLVESANRVRPRTLF